MNINKPAPRYQINLKAHYLIDSDGDAEEFYSTTTLNVSQTGCALLSGKRDEKVGRRLHINITLPPDGAVVAFQGVIIWSGPPILSETQKLVIPGTIGISFREGPVPVHYLHYLAQCEEARKQVDMSRVAFVNSALSQWSMSETLPVKERFELALTLTADLITAFATEEGHNLLTEAIEG